MQTNQATQQKGDEDKSAAIACLRQSFCSAANRKQSEAEYKQGNHLHSLPAHDCVAQESFQRDRSGLFQSPTPRDYGQCASI